MKPVRMFILRGCPYCKAALSWMEELKASNSDYSKINVEIIEETEQKAFADAHDYYRVPTWYVDGVKIHEGAASLEVVKRVFGKALAE